MNPNLRPGVREACSGDAALSRHERLPDWTRKPFRFTPAFHDMKARLRRAGLHTVCEEARCPNIGECFNRGTATFMILGDICTRRCGFCSVATARPAPPDPHEPDRVCETVGRLGLQHVVLTSPARDDLADGGAEGFAACARTLRTRLPKLTIEVLTPDFQGDRDSIEKVVRAGVHIFNHNVETVARLQKLVRPAASYERSLGVLRAAKEIEPSLPTKSGFMLGLGEAPAEVETLMRDLRAAGCDLLTIGQYLQPSKNCLPVQEYVRPEVFADLAVRAHALGFRHVASGSFVRSSYMAELAFHAKPL